MNHTVVILTHADATFRDTSIAEYLTGLPDPRPKDPETPSEGAGSTYEATVKAISMKKFLKDDVSQHIMAVNNKYRCEYERVKQRDALIELIDVVQTKNDAKCFKNQYFDKAEKRLKLRKKEEEKARERLLEQEVAESHDAINKARSLADHFSDAYLRNLQFIRMKLEIQTGFHDMIKSIESQVKELKEGISVMLSVTEPAGNPLQDCIRAMVKATVIETGKLRLIQKEEEEIFGIVEEAARRRQDQVQQEQEHKRKEEAVKWKPTEWYNMHKQKKEMKAKYKKLKHEEIEQVKSHQQKVDAINSNLHGIVLSIGKQVKEVKAKGIQLIRERGWSLHNFELAIEYAAQAASLIAEVIFRETETPELQARDADDFVHERNIVETQLISHLSAMRENIEMMLVFEARIEASNKVHQNPIQSIIEEVISKAASLIVGEVADHDTQKELGNMRMEWQMKALQQAKEYREGNLIGNEISIEQYEIATTYARLWSLYVAEENMRKRSLNAVESLRKEIVDDVFTEDLTTCITQVEKDLRFQLDMAGKGQETLAILSKIETEGKFTVLNKIAKESIFEATFFSNIEGARALYRKTALVHERKAQRMKTITRDHMAYQDNKEERKGYDLAKIFTAHASEFLADRYLKYVKLEEIRREDEKNFQDGMAYVANELNRELEKRDQAAFSYFKRFTTPEGKLSPIDKIARNSIQLMGKMMLLQPDHNLENKMKMETLREDWTKHIEQEKQEHEIQLGELIDVLTACVRDLAPEYAKSKDITQLERMKANGYKETITDLTPKVLGQLSDDAKTYFDEEKIGKSIAIYTELNEESLRQLAKDVKCFPADTTVLEEKKGRIGIAEVRVGDRILTSNSDGRVQYQDVFMLGKLHSVR